MIRFLEGDHGTIRHFWRVFHEFVSRGRVDVPVRR